MVVHTTTSCTCQNNKKVGRGLAGDADLDAVVDQSPRSKREPKPRVVVRLTKQGGFHTKTACTCQTNKKVGRGFAGYVDLDDVDLDDVDEDQDP